MKYDAQTDGRLQVTAGVRPCSSRYRWALWKAGRLNAARTQAERDREIRELLETALESSQEAVA
jgi:hypothetical protein